MDGTPDNEDYVFIKKDTHAKIERLEFAIALIYQNGNKLQGKKNGTNLSFLDLSLQVIQSGFEPETYCLEGSCSIQLSYWTKPQ